MDMETPTTNNKKALKLPAEFAHLLDDLGPFAEGVALWSRMIATSPDKRPAVFRSCVAEGASFVRKGAPMGLIAAELIERAERHHLVDELGGAEAVESLVAHGLNGETVPFEPFDERLNWEPQPEATFPPGANIQKLPPLSWISTATWDTIAVPEQDWIVRERFPRRQTALFSGEGSAGKSTLLLQLCAACAVARDWLGTVPEPGPTMFIDAEDDVDVIHRRLAAVVKHYGVSFKALDDGGLHLMSLAGQDTVMATVSRGGKIEPTPLYRQLLEACGDIKPVVIGLASSANFFAGNEVDRAQVQQFVGMMTRLAIMSNGSTILISHPSLTGISSDSGLSGNTQWHNSVRARVYIRGVKQDEDEASDTDLREIFWKKSNYGPMSDSVVVRWQNGLFLPVGGAASGHDAAAQSALADAVFLTVLKRLTKDNRWVSDKSGRNYAPAMFAKEEEARKAGLGKVALHAAMLRLFQAGVIWNLSYGKPGRSSFRVAIKPQDAVVQAGEQQLNLGGE
jgi:RecA-family ATPase